MRGCGEGEREGEESEGWRSDEKMEVREEGEVKD